MEGKMTAGYADWVRKNRLEEEDLRQAKPRTWAMNIGQAITMACNTQACHERRR
jgi:hypothetical protein